MRGDVRLSHGDVELAFAAKGGKPARYVTRGSRLAKAIARIRRLTGRRLLVYRGGDGALHPITASMINDYLKTIADSEVTAKDFRTFHASALAAEMMAELQPARSKAARKRQLAAVYKRVSEVLRNTPAITRSSYIAPVLVRLFDDGRLQAVRKGPAPSDRLHCREARLATLFDEVTDDGEALQ